jgi:guanine deaminase
VNETGKTIGYRASVLHCLDDPGDGAAENAIEYFEDGLLLVENGHVVELGAAQVLLAGRSGKIDVVDLSGELIIPGLIDCHVHFPQLDIIGSYGEQLLDWLQRYAYPAEMRLADAGIAVELAGVFADALLANGTTTAQVFATVHPHSVDAIFAAAEARNMRLIAGKVLMDRRCPAELRDDADAAYADSKALIERWHGKGRLRYAITPRFAVTSSEEQLEAAGRLAAEYPDVHVHTHLAENQDETDAVASLFPWSRSYLDVYERFGLVRERSMFAHCLHLDEEDWQLMAGRGASAAFCPSSNLFLGSGLFDLASAKRHAVATGIASDVGGGTSLNLLRTLSEAYKVLQLNDQSLHPFQALYLATLGAARALRLEQRIGNFRAGMEADFITLDARATPARARRLSGVSDVAQKLFALMFVGDERHVAATYLMGRKVC